MSKLSDINEVGRLSGTDKPKENPYEVKCICPTVNKISPWVEGSRYAGRPILPGDDE